MFLYIKRKLSLLVVVVLCPIHFLFCHSVQLRDVLGSRGVAVLTGVAAVAGVLGYMFAKRRHASSGLINKVHQKTKPKVVHTFKTSEIDKKTAFCRCWNSKTVSEFPECLARDLINFTSKKIICELVTAAKMINLF